MDLRQYLVQKNFEEKASYFAKSLPNMAVIDHGSFLMIDCGLPSDTFNVIVTKDLADPTQLLSDGVGYFTAKNFPMAIWYWEQTDKKADVETLTGYGLAHTETNMAMVAELATLNFKVDLPDSLVITYAESPDEIQAFGAFIAGLFGNSTEGRSVANYFEGLSEQPMSHFPAMQHYLGKVQGKVVASGTLFVGSESIGIYDIITHRDYRHRGIGSAMLAHLLNEAKSYQRRYVVLQASAEGMVIYLKAGFVPVGNVRVFEICQKA